MGGALEREAQLDAAAMECADVPGVVGASAGIMLVAPKRPDVFIPSDMKPAFIITIDTEGDNLWGRTAEIATLNAAYLPRFQRLCERFAFAPTWLTNYEMAMDPVFVEFGRDLVARGCGEIGMHLHAWNSPPLAPLTDDDMRHHPYLIEYPLDVMREKIAFMTQLLEAQFGVKMLSHRAGRWAFDAQYAQMLVDFGYIVDCSVTPGVSWQTHVGSPGGAGGTDYRRFPNLPYYLDLDDIARAGASPLLEVPMTTRPSRLAVLLPWAYSLPGVRRVAYRAAPPVHWLRPNGRNLSAMRRLVRQVVRERCAHLEFMLHSSELMPGGSPTFRTQASIEKLYDDLEVLFSDIAAGFSGATLGGFAQRYCSHARR
jgi:hypothetical protein